MNDADCTFNYAGYSLTAFYIEEDKRPIVTEVWLGDTNITDLVNERVMCKAHDECQQDIFNYDAYLFECIQEMRNDQWT